MKIKKNIVMFSLALMSLLYDAMAQNVTYDVPNLTLKNSIVRKMDNRDVFIIYSDDAGIRKFVYLDPMLSSVEVADFSASNFIVNDMEIVNGVLYFCGRSSLSADAVFGFFDIMALFFSAAPIKICTNNTYIISPVQTEVLTEYKQIEVQRISNNDIHIYMIAEAYNYIGQDVSHNYRCVVDVWETGLGMGTANTHEDFTGVYFFNDLAITDFDLVVVGDKHNGTGQYMHSYTLPTALTPCIFTAAPMALPYWFVPDNEYYPEPEVRMENLGNSYFAVACRGVIQSANKGIVVSIYKGAGGLVDRVLINDPYTTKQIRDLRYNPMTGCLSLLPDFQSTTKKNSHYVIKLTPTYTVAGVSMVTPFNIPELHSMDAFPSYEVITTGTSSGSLEIWQSSVVNDLCASYNAEPYIHHFYSEPYSTFEKTVRQWQYLYRNDFPVITTELLNTTCK